MKDLSNHLVFNNKWYIELGETNYSENCRQNKKTLNPTR